MLIQVASERKAPHEAVYSVRALEEHSRNTLHEWLSDQHIPSPIPKEKLHCSIVCACSLLPVDYTPDRRMIYIEPETFNLGLIGPAFALFFQSRQLDRQWQDAVEHGVEMMYQDYVPHISLSYEVTPEWNYEAVQPPNFALALVGEVVSQFDPQYAKRNWSNL